MQKPVVMGILNLTPDSFFDGGRYPDTNRVLLQVEKMLSEGASIIDIGGNSSRPGSEPVSEEIELQRVLPALKVILHNYPEAIISVDTFYSGVADACLELGASMVNDISAGDRDPQMLSVVAKYRSPIIIMHRKGESKTMQIEPFYENIVEEVLDFFISKLKKMRDAGIKDVVIDPGFGFGKDLTHNYALLKDLSAFKILNAPVMVGVSRKRMINEVLGIKPDDALNGTTVLNTLALLNGTHILRVHDVKEAVEAVKLTEKYMQALPSSKTNSL